jgi:prepilin-type processing-associated H-X9-DG protein
MIAAILLAAFIASIAWVWRDAERRGQPGFIVAVLVAFLFWPFSLIVWLLARPKIGATPTAGRRRSVGGVVLLVILLGIGLITVGSTLVGLGLPMIVKARSDGQRATCLNQVREIAAAYLKYQADNGRPPEYLHELGLGNPRCPSGTQSGPSTDPYELLPGTEPADIIVRERWTNHGGKGGAIAFGDGSVAWVNSPYKPIRMDVVKAQVEKQLREKLGEEFTKLGTVTFNAEQNRYVVEVYDRIMRNKARSVVEFSQVGAKEWEERGRQHIPIPAHKAVGSDPLQNYSNYAGTLSSQGFDVSLFVDELMERQIPAEKN